MQGSPKFGRCWWDKICTQRCYKVTHAGDEKSERNRRENNERGRQRSYLRISEVSPLEKTNSLQGDVNIDPATWWAWTIELVDREVEN